MATGTGEIAEPAQAADGFARGWRELRADSDIQFERDWQELRATDDIQFAPVPEPQPAEPPQWWQDFVDFLGRLFDPVADVFAWIAHALGVSLPVLMWILGGVAVALIGFLIWRFASGLKLRRKETPATEPQWVPDTGEALALLDEADRLAAEGRFDEATHLLLKRSVSQIAAAQPGLLEPASTAREIAALPALSQAARTAFGAIAERVERSLFALRSLSAEDWSVARNAYAEFALAVPQA